PGPPARPRDRLGAAPEGVCSFGLDYLAHACGPPLGLLGLAVEVGKRLEDRLALLRGRFRPDLRAHGRLTLKEDGRSDDGDVDDPSRPRLCCSCPGFRLAGRGC